MENVEILEYEELPNGKKFIADHLLYSMPFVCRGCLNNTKAFKNWHNDTYLSEKIGDTEVMVEARYDG